MNTTTWTVVTRTPKGRSFRPVMNGTTALEGLDWRRANAIAGVLSEKHGGTPAGAHLAGDATEREFWVIPDHATAYDLLGLGAHPDRVAVELAHGRVVYYPVRWDEPLAEFNAQDLDPEAIDRVAAEWAANAL